jgi:hypothetical protein
MWWIQLLTSPTVLISTFVIGALGEATKRVVNAFRRVPQYDENGHLIHAKTPDGKVITYRDSHGKEISPPDALWIRIFDATLPAQPVISGLLIGCIPWLPAEDLFVKEHFEFAGHLATYGAAGIFAKVGYDILVTTFRRFISMKAKEIVSILDFDTEPSIPPSNPPSPTPEPAPEPTSTPPTDSSNP